MSIEEKEKLTEAKETIEETVEEVVEEAAEETVEAVEEAAEETVEEAVEEAAEETVEEAEETDIFEKIKSSDLGKTIFGDDGKFDEEDIKRLSEEAGNVIKEGIEKVKNLF